MSSKKGNVVSNSIWLIAESILTMVISLVVGVISARYLGPSNYGLVNRLLPYISLLNSICTFGMQSIIIKELSKDSSKENVANVMGSTLVFRLGMSLISVICINAYSFLVAKEEGDLVFVISIIQSFSLIFNCYEIITYYYHAMLQSKFIAISTLITSIVVGIWKIVLLICQASVVWFAFSTTLQAVLLFALNYYFFRKNFRTKLSMNYSKLKKIVGDSYHLLLASMGIAIYGQLDKIMVGNILGNTELGYYTAAYTIATMWYFLPQAISNSMRSKIFSVSDDEETFDKHVRVLFLLTAIMGIVAGIGFNIIPGFCIRLLYGNEYIQARTTLVILGWVGLFANIGTARSIWMVGKGLHRYSKHFTLMGAVVNVILNGVLIPMLGIKGAAIATVVSQLCVQMVFPLFITETRPVVKQVLFCPKELRGLIEMLYNNFLRRK